MEPGPRSALDKAALRVGQQRLPLRGLFTHGCCMYSCAGARARRTYARQEKLMNERCMHFLLANTAQLPARI